MKVTDCLFEYTNDWNDVNIYTVSRAMKEYADYKVAEALKLAAENAKIIKKVPFGMM